MKTVVAFAFLGVVFFQCANPSNDNTDKTGEDKAPKESTGPVTKPEETSALSGCYIRVMGRDTLVANLQEKAGKVTGHLTYDNFEKDGSTGTVNGTNNDGIVKLLYTFQSEGTTSMMEVYFKQQGKNLLPGYGDMEYGKETFRFKNPSAINYPAKDKLSPVDCESLPEKFRE